MNKQRKKKKGLTLLELVIVLGLMGIVTSLIFSFVNTTQKKSKELEIRQELQHDGTMITESMMKNVLAAESIDEIKHATGDKNNIKAIGFQFNGTGYLSSDPSVTNIDKIKYQIDGSELNLYFHKKHPSIGGVIPVCEDLMICAEWGSKVQTLSENIKEIRFENKMINKMWTEGKPEADIKAAIKKEKSVNLKIILEADYYNKTIEHEHTIELSLRNAK